MNYVIVKAPTFRQLLETFRKGEPVKLIVKNNDVNSGTPINIVVKITLIEPYLNQDKEFFKEFFNITGEIRSGITGKQASWDYALQLPSQKHTGTFVARDS